MGKPGMGAHCKQESTVVKELLCYATCQLSLKIYGEEPVCDQAEAYYWEQEMFRKRFIEDWVSLDPGISRTRIGCIRNPVGHVIEF